LYVGLFGLHPVTFGLLKNGLRRVAITFITEVIGPSPHIPEQFGWQVVGSIVPGAMFGLEVIGDSLFKTVAEI
jgi:hypothetical protein